MLDKPRGFYVTGIDPSGPAARAGMHLGAVLLSFNGQNLTTAEQLQQLLTTAHIDVWYLMKKTTVTVSL